MDALRSEPRDVAEIARDLKKLQHVDSSERNEVMREAITLCRPLVRNAAASKRLQEADIQNLEQIVSLQIFRKINALEDPSRLIPWINTIARNMAINSQTRKQQTGTSNWDFEFDITQDDTLEEPWQILVESERATTLHQKISRLNGMDKEILNLAYFQELSMKEIAAELNTPIGTVKRRLHTARGRLKNLFNEND